MNSDSPNLHSWLQVGAWADHYGYRVQVIKIYPCLDIVVRYYDVERLVRVWELEAWVFRTFRDVRRYLDEGKTVRRREDARVVVRSPEDIGQLAPRDFVANDWEVVEP